MLYRCRTSLHCDLHSQPFAGFADPVAVPSGRVICQRPWKLLWEEFEEVPIHEPERYTAQICPITRRVWWVNNQCATWVEP